MKKIIPCAFLLIFCLVQIGAEAQKYDSTLRNGRMGYRVSCNNKSKDQNEVMVKLIGFDKEARGFDFFIHGKVVKSEIDDVNNDGFLDLLVQVFSGENSEFGTVYAFASVENKTVITFSLPDVQLDGKLKTGYKGHDQFALMEGTLLRKFPIYNTGDETDKPSGGTRTVQYQAQQDEKTGFKFKVLRAFDTK